MTKREQIMLAFCGVAALGTVVYYAAGALFSGSETVNLKQQNRQQLNTFIRTISQSANTQQLALHSDVIENAQNPSSRDPFLTKEYVPDSLRVIEVEEKKKSAEPEEKVDAVYSGFLTQGGKAFAFINGIDYQVGETLKGTDYRILSITETEVLLEKASANGKAKPRQVTLKIKTGMEGL